MIIIDHKRGDTLIWECQYKDDVGSPLDLTGYSIKCTAKNMFKKEDILFSEQVTDIYDIPNGRYRLVMQTTNFNLGDYVVNIEYTKGSVIQSTETFHLRVIQDITNAN